MTSGEPALRRVETVLYNGSVTATGSRRVFFVCGLACLFAPIGACSDKSREAPALQCPELAALERLHELLAAIERAEPANHVAAAVALIDGDIADDGFPADWRALSLRVATLARAYGDATRTADAGPGSERGALEDVHIDAAELRMAVHDSACMPAEVHRGFHQRLGMVRVPAGEFTMGCDPDKHPMCASEEQPAVRVHVPLYWIDRTEVTREEYRACVTAGVCAEVPALMLDIPGDHPMTGATFAEASDYCGFHGKRLATEAEWEKAARGTDERRYPWGDQPPTCERARYDECDAAGRPVGSYPHARSPYGALDMAGSAAEWVDGWFAESGGQRLVRDDAYDAWHMRATARSAVQGDSRGQAIGFRCAR